MSNTPTASIVEPPQPFNLQATIQFGPHVSRAYCLRRQDHQTLDLVEGIHRERSRNDTSPDISRTVAILVILPVDTSWESSHLLISFTYASRDGSTHQLDINLRTMMAQYADEPSNQWVVPDGLQPIAEKLRIFADNIVRRAHTFREKLVDHGLIDKSRPVSLFTCLLCGSGLQYCADCDSVAVCVNQQCAGAAVERLVTCPSHSFGLGIASCQQCFETNSVSTAVIRCPNCGEARCLLDVPWCNGRVVVPSDPKELELLRSRRWEGAEKTHTPRPGPCKTCADHVGQWRECCNVKCPSLRSEYVNFRLLPGCFQCPECASDGSLSCRCGEEWFCGFCMQIGASDLAICPQCETPYCFDCGYIERCALCGTMRPCDDCLEEQGSSSEHLGQTKLEGCSIFERCKGPSCPQSYCRSCIKDSDRCSRCPHLLCKACRSDGNTTCVNCGGSKQPSWSIISSAPNTIEMVFHY